MEPPDAQQTAASVPAATTGAGSLETLIHHALAARRDVARRRRWTRSVTGLGMLAWLPFTVSAVAYSWLGGHSAVPAAACGLATAFLIGGTAATIRSQARARQQVRDAMARLSRQEPALLFSAMGRATGRKGGAMDLQRWLGDLVEIRSLEVVSDDAAVQVRLVYVIRRTGEEIRTTIERRTT